jgi:hypothetical protein
MRIRLTLLNGPSQGTSFEVPDRGLFRLGADATVDAVLPGDPAVAPAHAAIYYGNGGARLRALLAGAPVWMDEREIEDAALGDGARFCVGSTWLAAEYLSEPAVAAPEAPVGDPRALARDALMATTGRLYAVLDAAHGDGVINLLRAVSHPKQCLYDGWAEEVYGDVAPWIVSVPRGGALMARLLRDVWGQGWGVFVQSDLPMPKVRKHLRRLNQVELEGQGKALFRWYDPLVLGAMHPTLPHDWLHREVVRAFIVEHGPDAVPRVLTPSA